MSLCYYSMASYLLGRDARVDCGGLWQEGIENERAELMEGTCEIQSEPSQGTAVHVDVQFVAPSRMHRLSPVNSE